MTNVHKIQKIIYDVNFDSEEQAYDFQGSVNGFMERDLLPVINEIFEEFDFQGQHIVIDSLQLDLGSVSFSGSTETIKERLRTELKKVLGERIAFIKNNPSDNEKIISQQKSEFKQLIDFLQKGIVTWNNAYDTNSEIDKKWLNALKNNQKELKQWLIDSGNNKNIRQRIINQFNDPQIIELINSVQPVESKFISEYSADIKKVHKKEPVISASESDFRIITWDVILSYVLTNRGSRFNRKTFVAQTIKQIASRYNLEYEKLLSIITASALKIKEKMNFNSEFPSIITELSEENRNAKTILDAKIKTSKTNTQALEDTPDVLLQEITKADFKELKKLVKTQKQELIEYLLHAISKESSRKKLTKLLKEEQIVWLIKILEPTESEFIIKFAKELKVKPSGRKTLSETKVQKQIKWQVVLTTMYQDRGSNFNRKSFVKSSLRQLAAHYNMSYKEIVLSFQQQFAQMPKPVNELAILSDVITELKDEYHIEEQQKQYPDEKVQRYIESNEIYDELINYLQYGFTSVNIRTVFGVDYEHLLLEKLVLISPDLAKQFVDQINNTVKLMQLIGNCSEEFVLSTISTMLKLKNGANSSNAKIFIAAVKQQATDSKDASIFYTSIVNHIADGVEIDLSKILLKTNKSKSELLKLTPDNPYSLSVIKYHLVNLLLKKASSINLSYAETWDYILKNYNKNVPTIIFHLLSSPHISNTFIQQTEKQILSKLLNTFTIQRESIELIEFLATNLSVFSQSSQVYNDITYWNTVFSVLMKYTPNKEYSFERILIERLISLSDDKSQIKKTSEIMLSITRDFSHTERINIKEILSQISSDLVLEHNEINKKYAKAKQIEKHALALIYGQYKRNYSFEQLTTVLSRMLKEKPNDFSEIVIRNMRNSEITKFWITHFSESLLRRLFFLILPQNFASVMPATDIIWRAYTSSIKELELEKPKYEKWYYIFQMLKSSRLGTSLNSDINNFINQLIKPIPKYSDRLFLDNLCQKLQNNSRPSEKELSISIVNQVKIIGQSKYNVAVNAKESGFKEEIINDNLEEEEDTKEVIYVKNAGMVLAAPYIPELFKRINLTENGKFKGREEAERAIHILQYMVEEKTNMPEFMLLLNKIICGIKTGIPIKKEIEIKDDEETMVQQLLQGMIQSWKFLGNTSVRGFRDSFLQREGVLQLNELGWELKVETKAYDMLLDQIPWSFSTIKYPWMENALYVKWR